MSSFFRASAKHMRLCDLAIGGMTVCSSVCYRRISFKRRVVQGCKGFKVNETEVVKRRKTKIFNQ